jgi:prolyl oligopeptidase
MNHRFRQAAFLSLALLWCGVALSAQTKPPVAPVRPVTDDYFGTAVTDPYRWMETSKDELRDYMKAENAVTQQALAPLAAQDEAVLHDLTQLSSAIPSISSINRAQIFYFYLELDPGKSDRVLMVRPVRGGKPRVLLDPALFAKDGKHAAIDYATPSWDGKYVLVGVSLGGSEDSTLYVLETATGKRLGESISRAQEANPSWADDGRSFYYSRLQLMPEGAPASAKFENMRVYYHELGHDPDKDTPVFGPDITHDPVLPKLGFIHAVHLRGTTLLLAGQATGVVETEAYWARASDTEPWRQIIRHEDGVMSWTSHGSRIYAISKSDAINGRIVTFDAATETFAHARILVAESDLILSSRADASVDAAADGLYVTATRNGLSVIQRFPYDHPEKPVSIKLPADGTSYTAGVDEKQSGALIGFTNWTTPSLIYRYDPAANTLTDTKMQPPDPADFSQVTSREVEVASADGTLVPLSIIYRKDIKLDGTSPTLLHAYGAYGYSQSPHFSTFVLPWLQREGVDAICHVRGGGEKGEAWHLAGMKQTKQHSIDDFVACARYLIAKNYTSPAHLAVEGTSAGGIAVGGFLTQHPELIQAVLYRVGITDILRSEQRSTGTANAAEYGSVKVEAEFRAMYAISPYAHVKDGASYPAVLLETGANDPRVTSWMLTKMTARLQAANRSANPILLRVDFDAGHGIGSNRTQLLKLIADEYTFLGWQLGVKGFESGAVGH